MVPIRDHVALCWRYDGLRGECKGDIDENRRLYSGYLGMYPHDLGLIGSRKLEHGERQTWGRRESSKNRGVETPKGGRGDCTHCNHGSLPLISTRLSSVDSRSSEGLRRSA